MKAGVLTYGSSEKYYPNIGDYIQSLAALQYANNSDVMYLDRERLDQYHGDAIKIVMNGWFMTEPSHFPPSKEVIPLFLSFHITPDAQSKILSKEGIDYLKNYEPIGCRDKDTMNLLQKHGIRSYFSGCLTLTLGYSYFSKNRDNNIYFVDPLIESPLSKIQFIQILISEIPHLRTVLNIFFKIKNHALFRKKDSIHKRFYNSILFYRQYSSIFSDEVLKHATFISHVVGLPDIKKQEACFDYAETLIQKYARASLVVTSRLHAALPCIGLETPCIFVITDEIARGRFNGLVKCLNVLKLEQQKLIPFDLFKHQYDKIIIESKKIILSSKIHNNDRYKPLKEMMIKNCSDFFRDC